MADRFGSVTPLRPRYWRNRGNDPLPSAWEALVAPLSAFPSWLIRIECERCGGDQLTDQSQLPLGAQKAMVCEVVACIRHKDCGGSAKLIELISGIEGSTMATPARRIRLMPVCA